MSDLRHIFLTGLLFLGAATLIGCSRLVDEDLTDCAPEFDVDYELMLVTNLQTELETVLDVETDIVVSDALKEHFENVFTDYAHDVDLSFYDTVEPMGRLEHLQEIMNASQTSYALHLPGRDYMHTCVANLNGDPTVTLEGDEFCSTARLVQHPSVKDTVEAHTTGLFTARQHLRIQTGTDQTFNVSLYMVNAATSLVLDMSDAPGAKDVRVFLSGFADSFSLADSTYHFDTSPIVRSQRVATENSSELCFASVHFPSRGISAPETKTIIDTDEEFPDEYSEEELWQIRVYITSSDGSVTETILGVHTPLRAGQFKVVKGRVREDGAVETSDQMVGASVALDWNPGLEHEIDF